MPNPAQLFIQAVGGRDVELPERSHDKRVAVLLDPDGEPAVLADRNRSGQLSTLLSSSRSGAALYWKEERRERLRRLHISAYSDDATRWQRGRPRRDAGP